MNVTVIGAQGFVGRHVVRKLNSRGIDCFTPAKNDLTIFNRPLGHVIYCAGVTSDFRKRPHDTIRAHVSLLNDMLDRSDFESLLYLSSTRVYIRQSGPESTIEEAGITVKPDAAEDLFNLSKLTGESLCLASGRSNVRIARLSNVCGDDFESGNFLFAIIQDAVEQGHIKLYSSLDSAKDYIHVDDAADLLIRIALTGKQRIYNVASGRNLSHRQWIERIAAATGCSVEVEGHSPTIRFEEIQTVRLREEFNYEPFDCLEMTESLIHTYQEKRKR